MLSLRCFEVLAVPKDTSSRVRSTSGRRALRIFRVCLTWWQKTPALAAPCHVLCSLWPVIPFDVWWTRFLRPMRKDIKIRRERNLKSRDLLKRTPTIALPSA